MAPVLCESDFARTVHQPGYIHSQLRTKRELQEEVAHFHGSGRTDVRTHHACQALSGPAVDGERLSLVGDGVRVGVDHLHQRLGLNGAVWVVVVAPGGPTSSLRSRGDG